MASEESSRETDPSDRTEVPIRLEFDRGTVLIKGDLPRDLEIPELVYDRRVGCRRLAAHHYRTLVAELHRRELPFDNSAGGFPRLSLNSRLERTPYPHQREAVDAWLSNGRRGVVVLPTGSGKTFVAQMILERIDRSALIVSPTIELMQQWYGVLSTGFDLDEDEIGVIGGGEYDLRPITVTTYDSAHLHMEHLGARFALLVFDECHHLPGPTYSMAAELSIAPFRLGLSATPEREDGGEDRYARLIGPIIYRKEIGELAGRFLAEYETVRLKVRLSDQERQEYRTRREVYLGFVRDAGIAMGSPRGWQRFIQLTARSEEGRKAFLAYRRQREIAQAADGKLRVLERLLARHRNDQALIFTNDNATVYRISRDFLIPAITHQTKTKERHSILASFNCGDLPFVVTSKVLNEGVDVPAASIGIVLSGSGSIREHVQRLGRILRRQEGKHALLYEIVAEDTAEVDTSERRRNHSAYSSTPGSRESSTRETARRRSS